MAGASALLPHEPGSGPAALFAMNLHCSVRCSWVAFNILGPAKNQLDAMSQDATTTKARPAQGKRRFK
jgi:hypothetical protein